MIDLVSVTQFNKNKHLAYILLAYIW